MELLRLSMKPGPNQAGPLATAKALVEYYMREVDYYINHNNEKDTIEGVLEDISRNDLDIHFIDGNPGDNEFRIVQAIWNDETDELNETNELNPNDIKTFFDIHEKMLEQHKIVNEYVGGLLYDFTAQSSVKYVLLTNIAASKRNWDYFNKLRDEKTALFKDGVQWELVDLGAIKSEYDKRESTDSESNVVPIPGIREYIMLPTSDKDNKKYKSIIVILPGTVLKDWSEYKENLFNENIRGFLGNKPTNRSIKATLANEPDLFYLYNNGISAICTNMEIMPNPSGDGETVTCTNFQIINGAQTVNSILYFNKEDNLLKDDIQTKLKDVNVLVRITEVKVAETKEEEDWARELKRNMIIYNNSQNVIKDADFRSNDLIQEILKAKFKEREIMYRAISPPLEVVYMPKRAYCSEEGKVVVYMDSMAKSLYAFKKKESMVKINSMSKFLFDVNDSEGYKFLFGDEKGNLVKEADKDKFDDRKFNKFAAIVILNHFLESRLREERKGTQPDDINGMVLRTGRLFLWAFGHVIREFYTDLEDEIYAKIIDGKVFESKPKTDRNSFIDTWYDHIYRSVHKLLTEEAKTEKTKVKKAKTENLKFKESKTEETNKENVETLNFKRWLRSEEKTRQLKDKLDDIYKELCDQEKLPKIK